MQRATQNLVSPFAPTAQPTLPISYFSAASFPLAPPSVVAKGFGWPAWGLGVEGVNSKLGVWLLDKLAGHPVDAEKQSQTVPEEPRIRGWTFLDYYSDSDAEGGRNLVSLLVECNFLGRKKGEEGC